jgi:hypothetical protein
VTVATIRADAVVLDGEDNIDFRGVDGDLHSGGARTPLNIRQALLCDAIQRLRDVGRTQLMLKVDAELAAQSGRL